MTQSSIRAKHVIIVLSGKGGVGKSTVACQLAMGLAFTSLGGVGCTDCNAPRVGILDVDICGPSVPFICGTATASVNIDSVTGKWFPVRLQQKESSVNGILEVMSIAYLLPNATDAVVWRGPRKDAMMKQFLTQVAWGSNKNNNFANKNNQPSDMPSDKDTVLDYLIVDTPPGTSDEHLSLCEMLQQLIQTDGTKTIVGAVVVTTPQDVSTDDVRKELSFCHKLKIRVFGIVENMSGYVCPHCAECTYIFSNGGGRSLANMYECPFLGAIPIDPRISLGEDNGEMFIKELLRTESVKVEGFVEVIQNIVFQVSRAAEQV